MLVVFRHPGGYGDELCPGGLNDSAEGFSGEISHSNAFLHQFGDEGQGRIDVPEGAQRYECDMHTKTPFKQQNSHAGSAGRCPHGCGENR